MQKRSRRPVKKAVDDDKEDSKSPEKAMEVAGGPNKASLKDKDKKIVSKPVQLFKQPINFYIVI